jgi:hypothetical protein
MIIKFKDFSRKRKTFLKNFANDIIQEKQAEFVEQSLDAYRTGASSGHCGFRGWGIVEATLGAFVWALLLIVLSIVASNQVDDRFEVAERGVSRALALAAWIA